MKHTLEKMLLRKFLVRGSESNSKYYTWDIAF